MILKDIYSSRLKPGQSYNQSIVLEPGRAYKITVNSTGEKVGCSSGFDCVIGDVTYQKMNVNTGGIRIAKVISLDGAKNISGIKSIL
ncbi:hypothetical protein CS542_04100 [Pedobacter sp. IW39]|nr:hypothetical protein CS542_04100 [Pedobacter sp. IW39]